MNASPPESSLVKNPEGLEMIAGTSAATVGKPLAEVAPAMYVSSEESAAMAVGVISPLAPVRYVA